MRARQTVVSNDGWQSFHVMYVHMYKYKYVIGESKDVSDRPPSTPGGGFLSYLNSPVHMCMLSVTGSREQQGQEIFFLGTYI